MRKETELLWLIPNDQYEEKGLKDGEGLFYSKGVFTSDHREISRDFCKNYGFSNYPELGGSHPEWGKYFAERGILVFFNSGNRIDGKYQGQLYIPNNLTEKQIAFLENQKDLFENEYSPNAVRVLICPDLDTEYGYKLSFGMRDTKKEEYISGTPYDKVDGIYALYKEAERQKENLNIRKR